MDELDGIPWQRQGVVLGIILENFIKDRPDLDGLILEKSWTFTWGKTSYDYSSLNTIEENLCMAGQKNGKNRPVLVGENLRYIPRQ